MFVDYWCFLVDYWCPGVFIGVPSSIIWIKRNAHSELAIDKNKRLIRMMAKKEDLIAKQAAIAKQMITLERDYLNGDEDDGDDSEGK